MKPSIKNKLSADKIEAANRELNELKSTVNAVTTTIEPQKVVEIQVETVSKPQITEGVRNVEIKPKSDSVMPKSNRVGEKPEKPEKPSRRSKIAIQAEEENLRLVRVTIDIPEDLHEKMKIKMILTKQTMKDYLLDFIRKDVGNATFGFK
ncbi:MAG: hypothetical protein U5L45_12650 [Saprospiraceae bacterium]|nr:hypothetical protein [Saprospiraceae bacterium]